MEKEEISTVEKKAESYDSFEEMSSISTLKGGNGNFLKTGI